MRKSAKFLTALSVAGLAVAAGSAFTGGGLTNAPVTDQFIGGTVAQTVTGATLSTVGYEFKDSTNTALTLVRLTFADAHSDGKTAAVTLKKAGGELGNANVTCATIAAAATTCTVSDYTGLIGLDITVS